MNVETYLNYFRQLAIRHKDLQHDVATETGGDGNKAFARFSPDEIVTGQRSQVGPRVLFIELPETKLQGELYSLQEAKTAAFGIYCQGAQNDFELEQRCFAQAEEILEDILNQLWQDHYGAGVSRCQTPFSYVYFNKFSIIPVGPLFTWYFGYRCEFEFKPITTRDYTLPLPPNTFL